MILWLACSEPPPPSVLLITLDTTRADHLGPYGHALADTPTYDALAEAGTVYTRAYASCPLTIPSHSTMFTGRYPPSHGVRDNGDFLLGPDQVTLAERLHEAGYTTAAFTAAFPTQARWGFDQGFELYHDPLKRLPTQLDWRDRRDAREVVDDALATLPKLGDGPLFVWAHFFDAHWPYEPPEPYLSEHAGRPYDGEIAFTDAQVARLLAWWDSQRPDSLVLVTSDHGEGFGEGGEKTHGFLLHDGTVHVPLLVRGRGFEAERVDEVVGHVDLVPTVLAHLRLEPHQGLQGHPLQEGGSDQVYSEALTGQFNLGLAPLFAISDAEGRYTEGAWGGFYPHRGFGISTVHEEPDPGHRTELALTRAALDEVLAPTAALDEQAFAQLAALGYLGGDVNADAGSIDPRDVIELIPLTWEVRQWMAMGRLDDAEAAVARLEAGMPDTYGVDLLRAQLHRSRGQLAESAEAFADLYLRSPSSTVALQLGALHAARGDWTEAESWYVEAAELQPASPEAMAGQVHAAHALGEPERARELADRALRIYPDHAELRLVLAEIHLAEGDIEAAAVEVELAIGPLARSPWAHATLAQVRWEQGRPDPAIEALQEALVLDRFNLPIRLRLVECLIEVGRNAEAVRTIAPAARLLPDNPDVSALSARAEAALKAERKRISP